MSLRHSRLTHALCSSVAPLLAGVFAVACSAGTGAPELAGTTSEALTSPSVLHSHVTRSSWHRHPGQSHGGWDDARRCHPPSLALCTLFDNDTGIETGGDASSCANVTTPACPDRVDTWDDLIVFDFAIALTNDCRFGQWAPPLLSDADVADYLNDLLGFTLQLFGCPLEGTTDPLTFGLIPSALESSRFTTADLDALADTYTAAVAQALSDIGAPPLSSDQLKAIDGKLRHLAHRVPGKVFSRKFNFSTCEADAGAPVPYSAVDESDSDCHQ
jgi:hypothetical protein